MKQEIAFENVARACILFLACSLVVTGCSSGDDSSAEATDAQPNTQANNNTINADPGEATTANSEPATCTYGMGTEHPQAADLQAALRASLTSGIPGISAAIYSPAHGLCTGAAGYSNLEEQTPVRPCSVFYSGSVAKMYTVSSAMTLVEEGLLNLDDPIANYIDAELADNLPNGRTATVRQLMNHTAGIPDHDNEDDLDDYIEANNGRLPSAEIQLATLFDNPPTHQPGEATLYSSAHTLILSLVMDKAAGEHHSKVISRNIIDRLGLTETFYQNGAMPENLVNGYFYEEGELVDYSVPSFNYADTSQGDAGVMASAHDYYLFMRALVEGQIVQASTFESMQEPRWVFQQDRYRLGNGMGLFIIALDNKVVKIGHSGLTAGGMSHVYYYPESNAYIVLMTNVMPVDDDLLAVSFGGELLVDGTIPSVMADLEAIVLQ